MPCLLFVRPPSTVAQSLVQAVLDQHWPDLKVQGQRGNPLARRAGVWCDLSIYPVGPPIHRGRILDKAVAQALFFNTTEPDSAT
ncbi:hypothetical protein [Pseudomonas sp. FEN]|uniref:hypothetical protein n=1 Tax=Pseudomonas sp. FEN TaxID=2767468 RepID=UPI00174E9096|nr:hypothetical protein [Pseudomonas sp. FEN]